MNDDDLEVAEGELDTQAVEYAAGKRRIVIMLLAYAGIMGIISCFLQERDSPLDFIVGLPILILSVSWCFTDADERDHRIGGLMRLILILFFVVGFPLYLIQTRGFHGFVTLGRAMLLTLAMFLCFLITFVATLYVGEATGLWRVVE